MIFNFLSKNKQPLLEDEDAGLRLVPLRQEDMIPIMHWRNAQIDCLRQSRPLTEKDQEHYYKTVVLPSKQERHPNLILFSYMRYDECIGYGGLVHIDWHEPAAEVSFLLNPEYTADVPLYNGLFRAFLRMLKHYAFEELHLKRLFTETYDLRPHHVETLESAGFFLEKLDLKSLNIQGKLVDVLHHSCYAPKK